MQKLIEGTRDYYITDEGKIFRLGSELKSWQKPWANHRGYLQVSLFLNGTILPVPVHKLVAHHFIGPRPIGLEIRHLDGNQQNNHVSNLAYGTHQENMRDITTERKWQRGTQRKDAKLNDESVTAIRQLWSEGVGRRILAERFGVSESQINRVAKLEVWKHVPFHGTLRPIKRRPRQAKSSGGTEGRAKPN